MRSERPGPPSASRGAAHAAKGFELGVAEVAILTVVVVGLKAVVPVEALASLYVLAVLPIAVGWGSAWALTVAVLSTLMFDGKCGASPRNRPHCGEWRPSSPRGGCRRRCSPRVTAEGRKLVAVEVTVMGRYDPE